MGTPTSASLPPSVGARTALVAASDPEIRRFVVGTLRQESFKVLEAPDGRWAIRRLFDHHGRLDLLVTDLQMPNLNGLQVAAMVTIARPETAVVLMTDDPSALGVTEHTLPGQVLHKPFDVDQLLSAIGAALGAAR